MKESKLQNIVKKYHERLGCLVYKTMGGFVKGANYTAAPGWPDLMIFNDKGKMFFIECKNEIGKLRDTQIVRIKQLQNLNHLVFIARPLHSIENEFSMETIYITNEEYRAAELRIKEHKEKKALERKLKREAKNDE